MTTASTTQSQHSSRNRTLAAILVVSVALNVCVVAGAVWSRINTPAPQTISERFHKIEDTLDLTPAQRVTFDAYIAAMVARAEHLHQEVEPTLNAAWTEIAKPDANEAMVMKFLDEVADRRHAFQHEAMDATLAMLATLTPEQRAKFGAAQQAFRAAQRRRRAEEAR